MTGAIDAGDSPNPKLPFWQTIGLSYSTYFRHFIDVLQISWLWLLVLAPVTGVASWMQMSWFADAVANMKSGKVSAMPIEMTIPGNISTVVMLLASCSIAVAWHRRVLLDELPGVSGSNLISRNMWRYVGVGIAICLIVGLPALAVMAPIFLWVLPDAGAGIGGPQNPALFLLLPIVYLAVLFVMLRLAPLLPAPAVGDLSLTFKQIWNRTHGNAWRLFWGLAACGAPPLLLAETAILILTGFPDPLKLADGAMVAQWVVNSVVLTSYSMLVMPISIGFLSYAYQYLFMRA